MLKQVCKQSSQQRQHTPKASCLCACCRLRAAAARARGDYSAAAQLTSEAVALRAAADAAHAAAALKIEVANNASSADGLVRDRCASFCLPLLFGVMHVLDAAG